MSSDSVRQRKAPVRFFRIPQSLIFISTSEMTTRPSARPQRSTARSTSKASVRLGGRQEQPTARCHRFSVSTMLVMMAVPLLYSPLSKKYFETPIAESDGAMRENPSESTESATLFFDCDGPNSECTYFRPTFFFDDPDGMGYEYREIAQRERYGSPTRNITGNYARAALKSPDLLPPKSSFPKDFTYIHLKKAGGITMKYALNMFVAPDRMGHNYETEIIYNMKAQQMGEDAFAKYVKSFLDKTVLYSFVRDPIDKFISASSQVVKNHNKEGGGPCFEIKMAKQKMQCFLRKLHAGEFVDEHLAPSSVELYQMAMGVDVKVVLTPLENLSDYLDYIGVPIFETNENKLANDGYTKDALDQDMISVICKVYQMDIQMFKSLGMEVPLCDSNSTESKELREKENAGATTGEVVEEGASTSDQNDTVFTDCGCPLSCDDAALSKRNRIFSCRERIQFLMNKYKVPHHKACSQASLEEHSPCGSECDPNSFLCE